MVNFVLPYMLSALTFKVGWVFGSIAIVATLHTFFFQPETKGRALEEIDKVFETSFNPFRHNAVASNGAYGG